MSPADAIRLRHMIEAARAALRFASGRTRQDLDDDEMFRFALVRAVEVVGEAASRVTEDGRALVPGLPWQAMAGMRNRLVHAYFAIDADVLWETVHRALPEMLSIVEAAMGEQ